MNILMLFVLVFLANCYAQEDSGKTPYIITALKDWKDILVEVGTTVAAILIILGAIVYGVSQMQPAEMIGKWESTAVGMVVGGILIAIIIGVSGMAVDFAQKNV